jgi:hypothetical protein
MTKMLGMASVIEVLFFKPLGMPDGLTQILIPESEFFTSEIQKEADCHHAQS